MKRYVLTLDLYIYADSDEDVKELAEQFAKDLDQLHDNKCNVVEIHENEFGTIGNRKVYPLEN